MSQPAGMALPYTLLAGLALSCSTHHVPAVTSAAPSRTGSSLAPSKPARQLQSDLSRVFGAPIMARGVWGVDVRSLRTGERLYSLDAERLMMPASNMKILTLAVAAELLGWEYRFTTTLESGAAVEGGVLRGDLFVRGTGDPTINSRAARGAAVFDEWAAALRGAGIYEIDGRIIGDDQAFEDEGLGAGWAWDYLQYGYAAPSGALEFNDDVAELVVQPAASPGEPAVVRLTNGSGLTVLNHAVTGSADSPQTLDYRRHLDRPLLEITGTVPVGTTALTRYVAVVNPTLFFGQALKDALIARGIPVSGDAVDFDDVATEFVATNGSSRRALVTTSSTPLREIATVLMKESQNLYAETLLKTVGAVRGGLGTSGSGRTVVRATLASWGIPDDAYIQADGSGLSRYNYLTAATVTSVLDHIYRDARHREAFSAALPIAGREGTLATRLRRTRAEGNAVAKTGSIANVRALSGYVRSRDGEMLVFSILANDFVIPAATVNWIADLAVEILANFSRH